MYKKSLTNTNDWITLVSNAVNGFQPFVLDLRNELTNGLIYMAKKDNNLERTYYLPSKQISYPLSQFLHDKKNTGIDKVPLSNPHWSSFIDLNGDCYPDLVFTSYDEGKQTYYIEYWFYISNDNYELYDYTEIKNVQNSNQISQLVIADFGIFSSKMLENKGSYDILFYNKDGNKFHRIRNDYRPKKEASITEVTLCHGYSINEKGKLHLLVFSILYSSNLYL